MMTPALPRLTTPHGAVTMTVRGHLHCDLSEVAECGDVELAATLTSGTTRVQVGFWAGAEQGVECFDLDAGHGSTDVGAHAEAVEAAVFAAWASGELRRAVLAWVAADHADKTAEVERRCRERLARAQRASERARREVAAHDPQLPPAVSDIAQALVAGGFTGTPEELVMVAQNLAGSPT